MGHPRVYLFRISNGHSDASTVYKRVFFQPTLNVWRLSFVPQLGKTGTDNFPPLAPVLTLCHLPPEKRQDSLSALSTKHGEESLKQPSGCCAKSYRMTNPLQLHFLTHRQTHPPLSHTFTFTYPHIKTPSYPTQTYTQNGHALHTLAHKDCYLRAHTHTHTQPITISYRHLNV